MWNGTMFVDLDWPLNASSLLSASAELLVLHTASGQKRQHAPGPILEGEIRNIRVSLKTFPTEE